MAAPTPTDEANARLPAGKSALEVSESRYRRLFETAQDAILILDAEERPGTIMDANPFVIDLLGYTLDELVGKELWEIGLFADKAESQAAMDHLQSEGYIRYEDIPLETKQGKRVDVEFVSNTYMVDGMTVIQCNIRDITERAVAAHALVASEARYRRLFETAQDAILILDAVSGKIMDANPFVIALLGYPLDELIGKELWEIGLFSDKRESKAAMLRLQETGYIRYEDMPLETKRGKRVEVEFVSNSYLVDDLEVIQCNIRDITDRKWAEEAARISAQRFQFLAESMPIIIFTARPNGDIDYCNRQLTEFTGLPCAEVSAAGRAPFTHPDEAEEDDRLWRRSIESGEPFQLESRFRRADGVYRWHLTRAAAMRDAGGIVIWIGSSTDIHDRKSVEETLVRQYHESEALSRAKDEFLAMSSHELRTPLTSILGWSELLVTGALDAGTQREALDTILQSARAQSRLIDDMLDVSRLLTGKLELNSEAVDVSAAVLLALRAITPAAERKGLTLEQSFARGSSRVDGDPTRLQQIFWNILSNAVKFTPDGGRIAVRLTSDDSWIHIVVRDSGLGISAAFLPHVFDSLSQERGSSTRSHGGLGLGLSIVKQLVQMHGGTVRAESMGEGQGSTFTVSLPACEVAAPPQERPMLQIRERRHPSAPDAPGSIAGRRVLVVDDELEMRRLITTILRAAGASVVTASSAAEALEHLAAHSFDALISDIAMPDEDGHSLTRRIRARTDDKSTIPAIAVTAYGGPLQHQLALSAGFDDYVKKPFAPRTSSAPSPPPSPSGAEAVHASPLPSGALAEARTALVGAFVLPAGGLDDSEGRFQASVGSTHGCERRSRASIGTFRASVGTLSRFHPTLSRFRRNLSRFHRNPVALPSEPFTLPSERCRASIGTFRASVGTCRASVGTVPASVGTLSCFRRNRSRFRQNPVVAEMKRSLRSRRPRKPAAAPAPETPTITKHGRCTPPRGGTFSAR